MDIILFELRAANNGCKEKFTDIANNLYKGIPIFEHACNYVNESSSYRRNGRKLEILEIFDYVIQVKLSSESKLEMASKSLAGFSRELIRVDQEMNPDEENRLFRYFIYNNTLFKNIRIPFEDYTTRDKYGMSDVDALKQCVDIFCNGATVSKEEAASLYKIKQEIKESLLEYNQRKSMMVYAQKMRQYEKKYLNE